jgi:GNAT superfamily N-acetyltransferase
MLDRSEFYTLKKLDPESEEFAALAAESRHEGYWMLVRLQEGWRDGRNRFSRRGETVLGAWRSGRLAGVCGLNVDPYIERRREGRVRHLYVRAGDRRNGVGRMLVEAIVERAKRYFPVINARAPAEAFRFYEALGFRRVESEEFFTHRMELKKPKRPRKTVKA